MQSGLHCKQEVTNLTKLVCSLSEASNSLNPNIDMPQIFNFQGHKNLCSTLSVSIKTG